MNAPVSVTVHPSGAVEVNGVLVAEVHLGPLDGPATVVAGRDVLAAELALHRIAFVVHERLVELLAHVEAGRAKPGMRGMSPSSPAERARFGEALVAGLLGEPGELTGDQCYRNGHRAGVTLRALARHLAGAAEAAGLARPGETVPT